MIITICVLIVVTIAIAAFVLAPRLSDERVVFDETPDRPAAFGYRMAWIAVRSTDAARVAHVLGLDAMQRANWRTGIGAAYDERLGETHVYVTAPVQGWTFVVGLGLPQPLGAAFLDKCTPMLLDLAAAFPEAHYYLSYPPLDCYAWARVADGKLARAYAIGDEGLIWNKGKPSPDERSFGLTLKAVKGVRKRKSDVGAPMPIYPTEAQVMHLAGLWSIDPTRIAPASAEPGLGLVCLAPAKWRPERMRRAG